MYKGNTLKLGYELRKMNIFSVVNCAVLIFDLFNNGIEMHLQLSFVLSAKVQVTVPTSVSVNPSIKCFFDMTKCNLIFFFKRFPVFMSSRYYSA